MARQQDPAEPVMQLLEGFTTGIAMAEYQAAPALSISRLKQLARSPRHYRWAMLANPTESRAMRLGTAAHCAVLEPWRFATDYVQWDRRTEGGKAAPRSGKAWEAFREEHAGFEIITADENALACAIARSVHGDPVARRYLINGEAEVGMRWDLNDRPCKGRLDWLAEVEGATVIVGLKTARDARLYPFGAAAARLGYALQWAWYHDGYMKLTGAVPRVVEIVVESAPPHAVVTYVIPDDVLEYGRDEYKQLLARLDECERNDDWHDIATTEQVLSLPSWVYGSEDDLTDLGLEAA